VKRLNPFGNAIIIKPNSAIYWYGRGCSLKNLGKFKEAISDFDKALELAPGFQNAIKCRQLAIAGLNNQR
jgi:tetratricopeptide (TPR) repeat protein